MLSVTLGVLASKLGCELTGDPEIPVTGVSTLEKAGPGEITFLANMKYAPKVKIRAPGLSGSAQPVLSRAVRSPMFHSQ